MECLPCSDVEHEQGTENIVESEPATEKTDCVKEHCESETPPEEMIVSEQETESQEVVSEMNQLQISPIKLPSVNFNNAKPIASTQNSFSSSQYLVGCKWSPDGSCLLTNCSDNLYRLYDLPKEIYETTKWDLGELAEPLKPSLTTRDASRINDYDWYPFMSSWKPETCCFLSASSSAPVHLIDAFTGQIQSSYSGYSWADEITTPYCVKFSPSGDFIYVGYLDQVKLFSTGRPGRQSTTFNVKQLNDQKGILSCIAVNPVMNSIFAVGSYRRTIGVYTQDGDGLCLFQGQLGGVTKLVYSLDGNRLYSGGRMDPEIICWDLRNPGKVLYCLEREVKTNQRIHFDVSCDGRYLYSGGTDGVVRIWDIDEEKFLLNAKPDFELPQQTDCVNGISLNNCYPVLATASGQIHGPDLISDEEEDSAFTYSQLPNKANNNVTLWWVGEVE